MTQMGTNEPPTPTIAARPVTLAERKFSFYLIINWKSGDVAVRRKPPDVSGNDIVLRVNLTMVVPERDPSVDIKVTLSETKVGEIVMEELTR